MINIQGDQSMPQSNSTSVIHTQAHPSIVLDDKGMNFDLGEDGSLTPRKLIYNSIISEIKHGMYKTKIDFYKIGKVIGKGAFGKVNLAVHRLTGKFVALKSINR
jgi:hypothetical protein